MEHPTFNPQALETPLVDLGTSSGTTSNTSDMERENKELKKQVAEMVEAMKLMALTQKQPAPTSGSSPTEGAKPSDNKTWNPQAPKRYEQQRPDRTAQGPNPSERRRPDRTDQGSKHSHPARNRQDSEFPETRDWSSWGAERPKRPDSQQPAQSPTYGYPPSEQQPSYPPKGALVPLPEGTLITRPDQLVASKIAFQSWDEANRDVRVLNTGPVYTIGKMKIVNQGASLEEIARFFQK